MSFPTDRPRTCDRPGARRKQSSFTLIELLAAMAILLVLMAVLFEMLAAAQKAWTLTNRTTEIYENARIALDLITRDLEAAAASSVTDEEIPFYAIASEIVMVSATQPLNTSANSRLCEVGYKKRGGSGTDQYQLVRQCICDQDGALWNFYGPGASTTWYNNGTGSGATGLNKVIDGVDEFSISCFPACSGSQNTLPQVVTISMTLFDPRLVDARVAGSDSWQETKRSFRKVIFLGGRD